MSPVQTINAPPADSAAVDSTPLGGSAASFRDRKLVDRGDVLILALNWGSRLFHGVALLLGIGAGTVVVAEQPPGAAWWVLAAFSLVFSLIGVVGFLSRPTRLDRRSGRLTSGPWWNKRQRPLSDITAVQLIPGKHREGEWEWPGFRPYELNLVFQEGKRLNVSNHADLSWTRRTAVRLAGFLDVPLIESERAITSDPGWTRVRR